MRRRSPSRGAHFQKQATSTPVGPSSSPRRVPRSQPMCTKPTSLASARSSPSCAPVISGGSSGSGIPSQIAYQPGRSSSTSNAGGTTVCGSSMLRSLTVRATPSCPSASRYGRASHRPRTGSVVHAAAGASSSSRRSRIASPGAMAAPRASAREANSRPSGDPSNSGSGSIQARYADERLGGHPGGNRRLHCTLQPCCWVPRTTTRATFAI